MKTYRALLLGAVTGISALVISSCAYDPYYSGASSSYGYGDGYGYGSSNFSTSFFVSTGNPRWGYDPYAGSYYDYTRRCYYDPYLYGYYPVGYRPRYVAGAPHPHGWSRGRGHIAPPSRIRSYNLTNYHNRGERYRGLGRDWSSNVRVHTGGRDEHRQTYGRDHRGHQGRDSRANFSGNRDYDQSRTRERSRESYQRNRGSSQGGSAPWTGNRSNRTIERGGPSVRVPQPQAPAPSPRIPRQPRADHESRRAALESLRGQGRRVNPAFRQPAPQPQSRPQIDTDRGNRGNRGSGEARSRGGRGVRGLGEG